MQIGISFIYMLKILTT